MNLRIALLFPSLLLAAACGSSGTGPAKAQTASGQKVAAGRKTLTPEEVAAKRKADAEREENLKRQIAAVKGLQPGGDEDESPTPTEDAMTFVDPATKQKLLKIEKNPTVYERDGLIYNAIVPRGKLPGSPIVRQDEKYYYVAAPERKVSPRDLVPDDPLQGELVGIVPVAEQEGEVVTPKIGKTALRFEEMSTGLPTTGMWRENIAVADLDGDGRPEIVAPSPRLSGLGMSVYRLDGNAWKKVDLKVEMGAGEPQLDYGGISTGDFNGDGKIDLAYIQHGGWPRVLINHGGFRFTAEQRGMPRDFSGRSIVLGDIDGDGRLDVVGMTDDDEWRDLNERDKEGRPIGEPNDRGYVKGYNVRSFIQKADGTLDERNSGLEPGCYGNALALAASPKDGGSPILATGCSYLGWDSVVFEYDRAAKTWRRGPFGESVEQMSLHGGAAIGTYHGHSAAFVSYLKAGPAGAKPAMGGYGLSVYFRDGKDWKRKRIVKVIGERVLAKALAVGDLDGDGLDDIAWGDDFAGRVRIFLQKRSGEFEEIEKAKEPSYRNQATSLAIADLDGDGKNDLVLMTQYLTSSRSRAGGLRVFLGRRD